MMCSRSRVLSLALPLLCAAGCAEEIVTQPGPGPLTMAVFDFSTDPPQVPIPTDLVMDPATGLLNIPPADATKQPAQAYVDAFLNTLNGWPAMIPGEVQFTGGVKKDTVNEQNIVVLEMDPADPTKASPVTDLLYEYKAVAGGSSLVRVYPPGGTWKRGARYVVYVVGGAKGLQDTMGKQVHRTAYFELAASTAPLCAWDAKSSWDAATKTCAAPAPGAPATGCCTFNYNGVIENMMRKQVREANPEMSLEEVEKLAKQTALETATTFELIRQGFNQMLDMAAKLNIARDDVVVLWSFKIADMNEAVFDPTVTPPQGPFPTDMVKDPKTGLLNLPIDPNASKAEQVLFAFLNTLDGFPVSFNGTVDFTDALDKASTDKGVLAFALDNSTPPKATKLDNVLVTYDEAKNQLVVGRQGGLLPATTHVLVAVGGANGLKNADTTFAAAPVRSAYMHLALSPHPLCDNYIATTGTCVGDPTVNVFLDDPAEITGGMTAKQKAAMFEPVRQAYDALLTTVTAADSSLQREDVRALWAFTTTSRTMVNVDPANAALPYPSDLMLDSTTGKVSIPPTPGETPEEKAMREGLNSLDGFTTQGTYFVPVAGVVAPASVAEPNAVLTLDVTMGIPMPAAMTPAVDNTAGAITFKPDAPLNEKSVYAVVLVSKGAAGTTAAQGGLADENGDCVIPSPFTVLLRGVDPVYDATTKKSLVSVLDDATAAQMEQGRQAAKQMFDGLKLMNIEREDVVGAWTMTTMGITEQMMQLRALPYTALPAGPKLTGALDKGLSSWPQTYIHAPKTGVGGIVTSGTFKSWWNLDPATGAFFPDPTKGSAVDVPFLLTVPAAAAPPTGWPVVIHLHGLFSSKAEALALASANAQKGLATLGFDLPFHGDRSACTKDDECDAGGTCDATTGQCSTKLADKDQNGIVDASGVAFLNLQNPFALRDNLRQAVIDASALLRTVVQGGASGLTGGPVTLDPAKVTVSGQSIGAIVATDWLAVEGNTVRGALNSPGLRLAEILLAPDGGKAWENMRKAMLQAMGVAEGSLEALRLLTTYSWVLDSADAGNFGRFIKKAQLDDLLKPGTKVPLKAVILQQAENDAAMPVSFSDPLATAIGVATTDTLYLGQQEGFFLLGAPDLPATQACRAQIATFLASGTVCTPVVSAGKYTGQCQ